MTSYPNLIPMTESKIARILDTIELYDYDRIYGGWWDRNIYAGGKRAIRESAQRYIDHLSAR